MEHFPIIAGQGFTEYIPYTAIESHEPQAIRNHGQTLKRLAERGGLDYAELLAVLEDRPYVKMESKTARVRIKELIFKNNEQP